VIGNYNDLNLNRDQKAGLIEAVTYVAKKYGIDVSEPVTGAYPC
jgi:nucleotidyltransferase/DNA polymerase involved in DNA repair